MKGQLQSLYYTTASFDRHFAEMTDWIDLIMDKTSNFSESVVEEEDEVTLSSISFGMGLYLLSFLTFVGNAMVLHAIRTEKRLQTVSEDEAWRRQKLEAFDNGDDNNEELSEQLSCPNIWHSYCLEVGDEKVFPSFPSHSVSNFAPSLFLRIRLPALIHLKKRL